MDKDRIELRSVSDLQSQIAKVAGGLVTFDGDLYAGKSTLACEIGEALTCPVLDLDAYLTRQQGVFVDALRIPELIHAVDEALGRSSVVFLSGVCMLRVLKVTKLDKALSIYVRRLSSIGIPNDLDTTDAEDGKPFDNHTEIPTIFKEIHAYHADYRPLANADIVFLRMTD